MKTLEEAIAYEKEKAEELKHHYDPLIHLEVKEHEQIVEWLKDYKRIKDNIAFISNKPIEDIYLEAYNKGVDDFSKLIEEWCWKHDQYNQDDLNELMRIQKMVKKIIIDGEDTQKINKS